MMKRIFRMQKMMLTACIAVAVLVLIYALAFMTEYQNLFGLRLPMNAGIAEFHDVMLQSFNRDLLAWAIAGAVFVGVAFGLEAMSAVPDRFALIVLTAFLLVLAGSAVSALVQIPGLEQAYASLDVTYLELEGLSDYQFNYLPFTIGKFVYAAQAVVYVLSALVLTVSHVTFRRLGKEVHAG